MTSSFDLYTSITSLQHRSEGLLKGTEKISSYLKQDSHRTTENHEQRRGTNACMAIAAFESNEVSDLNQGWHVLKHVVLKLF